MVRRWPSFLPKKRSTGSRDPLSDQPIFVRLHKRWYCRWLVPIATSLPSLRRGLSRVTKSTEQEAGKPGSQKRGEGRQDSPDDVYVSEIRPMEKVQK